MNASSRPQFKLLIDTCVWLDLARDSQHRALLSALEELVRENQVSLIVPRIILDEFTRNKARITQESTRSMSSVLKRVKEAVSKFGNGSGKRAALQQLDDVDHKIPLLGEAAFESIHRIETLLRASNVFEVSDAVKLSAAQRAIDGRAPFHRQRNGMADAILVEQYAAALQDTTAARCRYAFVTHNVKDFSHPTGDNRLPHPDLAPLFSRIKSRYFISLAESLRRVDAARVSDTMFEEEWMPEPRRMTEILEATDELLDKIWYNRHLGLRYGVQKGTIKIIERDKWTPENNARTIVREVWEGAKKAAQRVEKRRGLSNLGPWSDFEWGMLNGKLSALRWVLGEEWDMLDT
jgi:predicted nucleic acid-binding protein